MPSFKTENALLLAFRPLGEKDFILSVFTRENGRYLGVLKTKHPPQTGSFLNLRWQARLSDQLGRFYLDDIHAFYADFLDDKIRLYILSSLCSILNNILPERQKADRVYELTKAFLDKISDPSVIKHYALWEADLLKTVGFGFDFSFCADSDATGVSAFVSPKTGRVVSWKQGRPYAHVLLPLPTFLKHPQHAAEKPHIIQALTLTGYFLTRYAGLKSLPPMREQLLYVLQTGRTESEKL